jgi:hypothetical protein
MEEISMSGGMGADRKRGRKATAPARHPIDSWLKAAWMRERSRPIPVIMFTAHTRELAEAQLGVSDRSKSAGLPGFSPQAVRPSSLGRNGGSCRRGSCGGSCSSVSVRRASDRPIAGGLIAAFSTATSVALPCCAHSTSCPTAGGSHATTYRSDPAARVTRRS